jgi:hypothetical protein
MGDTLLLPSEWRSLVEKTTRPGAWVPLTVVGGTGLHRTEFFHLHEDWIEWPGDRPDEPSNPLIRIPEEEDCRRKKVPQGHNSDVDTIERDEPCDICQSNVSPGDGLDQKFRTRRREGVSRLVPVVDKDAADALTWWFKQHDTIPWQNGYTVLNTIAKEHLDRSERINHTALRRTFVARAAKMDLDLDLIADSVGVHSRELKEKGKPFTIIAKQFGDYNHVSYTQRSFQDYLMVLHTIGPASQGEIADALDLTYSGVRVQMRTLKEEGFIDKVGETSRGAPIWKAVAPPDTELECRNPDCKMSFDSTRGRGIHESMVHDN